MKKLFTCVFTLFIINQLKAQDVAGSWLGPVSISGINLHLGFNIRKVADTGYTATFDSPDQKAFGIPCGKAYRKKDSLFIEIPAIGGGYKGLWDNKDGITGTFSQGLRQLPLSLKRVTEAEKEAAVKGPVRTQTPKQPYGYHTEDVEYDNTSKRMHYGATFTRPDGDGKYPAVIIISGSGTQDRDGSMMGHKFYWVLADYLTKNGIAVLRVDDRGAGKSALGDSVSKRTSVDFSYDVEASLNYLETRADVDKKHLGLIGHSEGGLIAPMVAARRKDVSFIVLWGGPGISGAQILAEQSARALKQQGMDSSVINAYEQLHIQILKLFATSPTRDILDQKITPVFEAWEKNQTQQTLSALNLRDNPLENVLKTYNSLYDSGWLRFFISYDPVPALEKVKCSVLAVNGEKDTQVIAGENLTGIKEALTKSGNKDFETIAIPSLNHFLQTAVTGEASEYEKTDETISPVALNIICNWIKLHAK